MTITKDDVIALMNRFHDVVMVEKGTGAQQASFFLRPDEARIISHHGDDLSTEDNYDVHRSSPTSGTFRSNPGTSSP